MDITLLEIIIIVTILNVQVNNGYHSFWKLSS